VISQHEVGALKQVHLKSHRPGSYSKEHRYTAGERTLVIDYLRSLRMALMRYIFFAFAPYWSFSSPRAPALVYRNPERAGP